jgi:hypothetical protein
MMTMTRKRKRKRKRKGKTIPAMVSKTTYLRCSENQLQSMPCLPNPTLQKMVAEHGRRLVGAKLKAILYYRRWRSGDGREP